MCVKVDDCKNKTLTETEVNGKSRICLEGICFVSSILLNEKKILVPSISKIIRVHYHDCV